MYADFEYILQPVDTCGQNLKVSYSNKTMIQEGFSFAYLIKSPFNDTLTKFVTYRGRDTAGAFISQNEGNFRNIYLKYLRDADPIHTLTP